MYIIYYLKFVFDSDLYLKEMIKSFSQTDDGWSDIYLFKRIKQS